MTAFLQMAACGKGAEAAGGGGITLVSTTVFDVATSGSPQTLTYGGAPQADDFCLLWGVADHDKMIAPSSDTWIEEVNDFQQNLDYVLYSRKLAGGETTVDLEPKVSSTRVTAVLAMLFRGVHTTSPIRVAPIITNYASASSFNAPDIASGLTADDWVIGLFGLDDDGTATMSAWGLPDNQSENSGGGAGTGALAACCTEVSTAASHTVGTFTTSLADTAVAITLALRPA